jgi:hypothetical protein
MIGIIFITHNFKPEFINTLKKIDTHPDIFKYKVFVLFDDSHDYENYINDLFQHVSIIKIKRITTSYDHLGHSMYINYFQQNYNSIKQYQYIWFIENDVYYLGNLIDFIQTHSGYDYDLMVSEYGTRDFLWGWTDQLTGFQSKKNIGVLAVIMRMSQKLLLILINILDKSHTGYLESILPHICIENNLSIHQFLPETCGIITTDGRLPLLKLIENDIKNNTRFYIENKIYHPIKL